MNKLFSKQYAEENCGCYSKQELYELSFMKSESISLESILISEISLKDKYWFVCKKLATLKENQIIAIGVVEIVLPIYEEKYQNNKAPRNAIEVAKRYIKSEISLEELIKARDAAYDVAAAAAAYAYTSFYSSAYASAAAAYASAASAAAAAATTTTAAAAAAYASAADAAYAAASAAAYKERLLIFLINFCNNA